MSSTPPLDEYSEVADQQLDILEKTSEAHFYNAIIEVCAEILDHPGEVRKFSNVISTDEGLRFSTAIPGGNPYKVFWSMSQDGLSRIEAVFPYPL